MGVLWVSKGCLEGIWRVSWGCLEGVWKVSKGCLEVAWRVSGRSLEGVWKVYQVKSSQDRSSQDRSSQDRSSQDRSSQDRSSQGKQVRTGQGKTVRTITFLDQKALENRVWLWRLPNLFLFFIANIASEVSLIWSKSCSRIIYGQGWVKRLEQFLIFRIQLPYHYIRIFSPSCTRMNS